MSMLQYHHCRSLDNVVYGEIKAYPEYSDPDFKGAYFWLKKEVEFYPLFLAVGISDQNIRITGYQGQWKRLLLEGPNGNEYRKKGEFPNDVLFSFREVEGIFMDYFAWHFVLNAYPKYEITDYEKRQIFKSSWSKSKWLRKARKDYPVQLVTSTLFLPNAERIWVRNRQTRNLLESMGFKNVEVRKLLLNE